MPSKTYRHTLVVGVVSDTDRGQRQMQARLHRWLENFGHTASSFGFEFRTVDAIDEIAAQARPDGGGPNV